MPHSQFTVGELRRKVSLGTEAVYRVCGWDDELVELEVVRAPGLASGERFRFANAAVEAMAVLRPEDEGDAGPASEIG